MQKRELIKIFLVDSGVTKDNIDTLLRYDNGVIVETSLKTGKIFSKEK